MKLGISNSIVVGFVLALSSCSTVSHQTKPVTVAIAVSTKPAAIAVASARGSVAVASKKIDEAQSVLRTAREAAGAGGTVDWNAALDKSNASLVDARVSLSSATDSLTTTTNELSVVQTKADFLTEQNKTLVVAYTQRDHEATEAERASAGWKTKAQSRARWVAIWATTSGGEFLTILLLGYLLLKPSALL